MKILFFLLVISGLIVGCTGRTYQVIDAGNDQPISGVEVTFFEQYSGTSRKVETQIADDNGKVFLSSIFRWSRHGYIVFDHPNYASGRIDLESDIRSIKMRPIE